MIIIQRKNNVFPIEYEVLDASINIFDEVFTIPKIVRKFDNLKIKEHQKLIRKLEVLEDGDQINIKFTPINPMENGYEDEFYFD